MPRYFFHVEDGETYPDEEGTALEDLAAMRLSALQSFAQTMNDNAAEVWSSGSLRMFIKDETGASIATLELTVREG